MRRAEQQTSAVPVPHDELIVPDAARQLALTCLPMLLASGALLWPADPDDADAVAILTARLHRHGMLTGRRLG